MILSGLHSVYRHLNRSRVLSFDKFKQLNITPLIVSNEKYLVNVFQIRYLDIHKKKTVQKKIQTTSKYLAIKKKKENKRHVDVWDKMSIKDFAKAIDQDPEDVFECILSIPEANHINSIHQPFNNRTAIVALAKKLKMFPRFVVTKKEEIFEKNNDIVISPIKPEDLSPRPPVVAIMGHIDHGKTTLLDYLRNSRIVESEFGKITQHIGAFSVNLDDKRTVTFIDTPGHAAFKSMRYRGALATDIVVLVVDSTEGVLEQTLESIRMINEAGTKMVVAINKIDLPTSDIDKTKQELKDAGIDLEDFGGDVQVVPISALKGTNVKDLIEALSIQADIMQLKADYKGQMEGIVIESFIEKGLGKSATVLVKRGSLKKGDYLVCGTSWGKVKNILDDRNNVVKISKPSQAVKVSGFKNKLPSAGDPVYQVPGEQRAKEVVNWRTEEENKLKISEEFKSIDKFREKAREEYLKYRETKANASIKMIKRIKYNISVDEEDIPIVSIIIKTDVDGSLDAILSALESYNESQVKLDIASFGVGEITESDIKIAETFNSLIYAFNVDINKNLIGLAKSSGIEIKQINIIYSLVNDLISEINKKMPTVLLEDVIGVAKVQKEFLITEKGKQVPVAGCLVTNGTINKVDNVKVVRNKNVIYKGKISKLKHLKNEVSTLTDKKEGGILLEDLSIRFEEDDQIICFKNYEKKMETEWRTEF